MLQKTVTLFSLLLLFACSKQEEVVLRGTKMGIPYSVKVRTSTLSKEEIKEVVEECFSLIDSTMNDWNPSSEIARWNRDTSCKPIPISPSLRDILLLADEAYYESHGTFDPSLGKIIRLTKNALKIGKLLGKEEIALLAPSIGWDKVVLGKGTLQKLHPDLEIDLDGISKGYFCDICAKKIEALGANHLLVEWGGEVKAVGGPFKVLSLGKVLSLSNRSIATSGYLYQLYPVSEESSYSIYSHFLDPKSLRPILVNRLEQETSYSHSSCAMADALSTCKQLKISDL